MAAVADGLFAHHDLQVEIDDPPGGPDNIRWVAEGRRDVCLTSVHHLLTARAESGDLAARFVAVIVRRSPVSAVMLADSPAASLAELGGLLLGGPPENPHTIEFFATLRDLDVAPPVLVALAETDARAALARREVDVIVGFADGLPRSSRLTGVALRALPVGLNVYASGLVVADRISDVAAARTRDALIGALIAQRDDPARGLRELCRRYPDTVPAEARAGWQLIEPYIFTGDEPGSMDTEHWRETLRFATGARGLEMPRVDRIVRPGFAEDWPATRAAALSDEAPVSNEEPA